MKEDFSDCDYIGAELTFYTYTDFCNQRQIIKREYVKLNNIQKTFYHYYIYANQHMLLMYKDRIKEYLEDDCTEEDLLKLLKTYKPR